MTERESDVSARWRGGLGAEGLGGKKLNQSLITIELTRCVHIQSSHKNENCESSREKKKRKIHKSE